MIYNLERLYYYILLLKLYIFTQCLLYFLLKYFNLIMTQHNIQNRWLNANTYLNIFFYYCFHHIHMYFFDVCVYIYICYLAKHIYFSSAISY